ncbi:hypothetical protein [Nonomuraea sp. NPDC003214]
MSTDDRDWFAPASGRPARPDDRPPATPPPAGSPLGGSPYPEGPPQGGRPYAPQDPGPQPPSQGGPPYPGGAPQGGQPLPGRRRRSRPVPPGQGTPGHAAPAPGQGRPGAPPGQQPYPGMQRRVGAHPDQQVWPPMRRESTSSTQPIPAIPSAGPLPPGAAQPPGLAHPPGAPAQGPQARPGAASGDAEPPGDDDRTAAQPPKRPRTVLLGVGAVLALALSIGLPTADRYLFYKSGQPGETVHVVPAGQEKTFEHVTWKSSIEPMEAPPGGRHNTPDKQWLKIVVTRKAADETGAVLTGVPELTLEDRRERTWRVEIVENDLPTDKHEVGVPYSYTAGAVVPKAVAAEVELHLAPDITYRSDTPVDKLMAISPEDEAKAARNDVLVFRR